MTDRLDARSVDVVEARDVASALVEHDQGGRPPGVAADRRTQFVGDALHDQPRRVVDRPFGCHPAVWTDRPDDGRPDDGRPCRPALHRRPAAPSSTATSASKARNPAISRRSRRENGGTPGMGTARIVRTSTSAAFARRRDRSSDDNAAATAEPVSSAVLAGPVRPPFGPLLQLPRRAIQARRCWAARRARCALDEGRVRGRGPGTALRSLVARSWCMATSAHLYCAEAVSAGRRSSAGPTWRASSPPKIVAAWRRR
jgi:hypothetical protein